MARNEEGRKREGGPQSFEEIRVKSEQREREPVAEVALFDLPDLPESALTTLSSFSLFLLLQLSPDFLFFYTFAFP